MIMDEKKRFESMNKKKKNQFSRKSGKITKSNSQVFNFRKRRLISVSTTNGIIGSDMDLAVKNCSTDKKGFQPKLSDADRRQLRYMKRVQSEVQPTNFRKANRPDDEDEEQIVTDKYAIREVVSENEDSSNETHHE